MLVDPCARELLDRVPGVLEDEPLTARVSALHEHVGIDEPAAPVVSGQSAQMREERVVHAGNVA